VRSQRGRRASAAPGSSDLVPYGEEGSFRLMIAYRRFGDQPLIRLMKAHRYSYTLLAEQIGVSRAQLVYAARGISTPSPELRTKLSNFFGVAPGELFTPAALAAKYNEGMARGGKNRWRGAAAA
jgi:hypothetical protein